MARQKFVAGNWKMNTGLGEATTLASQVVTGLGGKPGVEVVLCPPYVWLAAVAAVVRDSPVRLGAQNAYFEKKGAYTGEISPAMLRELGCEYVILGHSERRHGLGESDSVINQKVHAALAEGLRVILCVGETLTERERGITERILERQLYAGCAGLTEDQFARLVIAYEPVWAIGTGQVATPEQAQRAHQEIRRRVARLHGEALAGSLTILYGGSVTPENAPGLLVQPDIDGALVGGASLKADSFLAIVRAAAAVG